MVNFMSDEVRTWQVCLQSARQTLNHIEDLTRNIYFQGEPKVYREMLKLVDIQRKNLKELEEKLEVATPRPS